MTGSCIPEAGQKEKAAAAVYGYEQDPDGIHPENVTDTARIYAEKVPQQFWKFSKNQRANRLNSWNESIRASGRNDIGTSCTVLTGRPAEIMEGSENAYITGTWNTETRVFEKWMEPVLDEFGLVKYYPESGALYKKGLSRSMTGMGTM